MRLQSLFESEPDLGVVHLDADDRIEAANAAARRIYLHEGRADEALEGQALRSLYPAPFAGEVDRFRGLLAREDRPLLIRGIWRGHGVYTSVHPAPGGGCVLLGRRGAVSGPEVAPSRHVRVDAEVLELGELSVLTPRELEVLALLGSGGTLKDAAADLRRSVKTVESHRDNIARKLGLSRRGELVRVVERSGLRPADVGRSRLILDRAGPRPGSLGASSQIR
ncbi:putative LuxR family transcriptional regulator [Phycisphaera mikurensis NBRC 102666]|uniref:Putative LuxR family transcriptional regulator n=1 Tax=Phycisphaera mikurensis (strain NBRC 102666 / KCTC 22515 / FYK2301M01) TaxID=1142394 RepID=I0IAK5_PHYMF|nr:putative LuxR family transcriptional regulator [Phycisphaera mikurensis NBRC 102666]